MPHALFLGSSLAGIDRLDMLPRPPVHPSERAKTYFMRKMRNRLGYSSRRKGGFASAQGETDQGLNDIELRPVVTLTGLAGPSVRVPPSGSVELGLDGALRSAHGQQDPMEQEQNVEGRGKDLVGTTSMTSDIAAEDKEYAEELERYKAELSKFDRVKWVTLHLWHASVSLCASIRATFFPLTCPLSQPGACVAHILGRYHRLPPRFCPQHQRLDPHSRRRRILLLGQRGLCR